MLFVFHLIVYFGHACDRGLYFIFMFRHLGWVDHMSPMLQKLCMEYWQFPWQMVTMWIFICQRSYSGTNIYMLFYELFLTDTGLVVAVVFCLEFSFTSLRALGFDCLQKLHREFASKLLALSPNISKSMEKNDVL